MLLQKLLEKLMLETALLKPMTVIVPRNVNCNKGLIATQAKPVCIISHSIKEITSDERKTLNDPGYTLATFPKVAKYIYAPRNKRRKGASQTSQRCSLQGSTAHPEEPTHTSRHQTSAYAGG